MPSDKLSRLIKWFGPFESAVVAFSGGVDSSLVAYAAHSALEDRSLAVTFDSPLLPPGEMEQAVSLARAMGIEHEVIRTHVPEEVLANDRLRCYYCKRGEMGFLVRLAKERGFQVVVDGTNASDLSGGWRPGAKALSEVGVRSPLAELRLTKEDVREMAGEAGLPNSDKPSMACLASRFPYGHRIALEELRKVGAAEIFIRQLGFRVVRVRHFGEVARIEVGREEIPKLFQQDIPDRIFARLKELGFQYVDVDIRGYRTGSMDEPHLERSARDLSRRDEPSLGPLEPGSTRQSRGLSETGS
ncbi:MAG: ATP-dependent sacrificial sulfur transferase LarE [Conexivisphaerales archaeon]|nr:ATP-dependent sacrificial sulfur transferase LarE [Conexivisphaerales archaeon]